MTNNSLKKYWIILTSVCTIGTTIALACAGDWGPEYGTSSFTPEVFVDSALSPFFYSQQYYYGIGHDENHLTRWKYENIGDWGQWLSKSLPYQTLDYLLDSADTKTLDSAKARFTGQPKLLAFVKYLTYAKKCEAFACNPIQQAWEIDSTKPKPHFDATQLNNQLATELTNSNDPFIRQRYWFQLIRSAYFNSNPLETLRVFDTYSPKFPHNKLWYRCLAYTAGAYYKQKQYSKANYIYSRVYDSCDELKTVAHYSFHPQEEADWQGTLALCHNNEEKATLWQMLGIFYSDPQRAIARIYELDPRSEKLDILLSRAVNLYEQHGMPNGSEDKSPYSGKDSLQNLIIRIAGAGNTAKPWIWNIAAGYINTLDRHYSTAATYFKKAELLLPRDTAAQSQFRLLRTLNTLAAARTIDHAMEQQLLPDIKWLEGIQTNSNLRCEYAFGWLKKTMAAKYLLTGDKVRSECFVSTPGFYTTDQNVESLKTFLSKTGKTPYEQLCAHLSAIQRPDIFEYQAVSRVLNDQLPEALAALNEVPTAATTMLPGNPFNARINDCHDCDHTAAQKIKYSKLSFVQKLMVLKDKITAGTDVYTNAVLLGNAQYNITHFGNARAFYEGKVFGTEHSMPESIDSVFRPQLLSMTTAIKYYTLALGSAKTDEQRAKCQYLLAKCQRNDWYRKNVFSRDDYTYNFHGPKWVEWDGFKALKQYPQTQYYKEVLKECDYFREYTQSK